MAQGVFSLIEVRTEQVSNIANQNFASWPESATYGYYAGGSPPATGISIIDRIDFNTEVVSTPGTPLGRDTNEFAGFSSPLYGYFGGGDTPVTASDTRIDRLDFSTETISNPGNNLNPGRQALVATSNNSYGYFGGGNISGGVINTITRLDFSTETVSDPTKNLPTSRSHLAATSSNSYGYFGGGATPGTINTITRLDFSTETVSDPTKNLPTSRSHLAAVSSSSYGYFGGGVITPGTSSTIINTISRLDFSNETVSNPGKNLDTATEALAATSSSFYGYLGGGNTPLATPPSFPLPPGTLINTISRLDFSNETNSLPGNNLPTERFSLAAISGGASVSKNSINKTYGYFGGKNSAASSDVYRFDFSTESLTSTSNNQGFNLVNSSVTTSNLYAYLGGGETPSGLGSNIRSTITRLDFSNETLNNAKNNLLASRLSMGAVSSNSYGYYAGGVNPPSTVVSTIYRLDFSNETVSDPNKKLPSERYALTSASVSSNSYGYYSGGRIPGTPGITNTITRLDFSNETVNDLSTGLPSSLYNNATTLNNLYGYFGGGETSTPFTPPTRTGTCTISRIDFSNDVISTPGKNLPNQRFDHTSTSSNSYGYFAGGVERDFGPLSGVSNASITERLDFSTETITRGNPTGVSIRDDMVGFSNSN